MMTAKHSRDTLLVLCVIFLIILVVFLKINPDLFNQNIGSFEYIRTGERLIDKGKYFDAVRFFEKAFEASPDSDIIKASLAWLYTVCAKELLSADNTAKAIYFFTKAYESKPNQATALNLSIAYAKQSIGNLRRGDWSKGIAGYTKSRELVSEYPAASENLGIYLYNDAQGEFKAGRDIIAVLLLSESFLASESKYPFVLLGDIYYRRTDLDQAAFYWGKALEIDPENKALAEKAGRLSKEMELAKHQQKSEMPHFELRYDSKLRFDVSAVQEALEKAYAKIGKRLAYFPKDKTVVFLYSEEDFRNIFKLSPVVRAFYDGNMRMPLPGGPLAGDELTQYIEHEYAHAVISAVTENNCPPWLGEGIAVSIQMGKNDPMVKDVLLRAGDLSTISMDSIDSAFKDASKSKVDLGVYYIIAHTMVEYIIESFGDEALRGVLKRLRSGQHFVNAMDDQLLMSQKEFEKRWRVYTEKRFLR